ncbi:MAG: hypothetical protein RMK60_02955 [Burkholderiales bacterium]|nr:hypothetical protein [Burkholderiales bacterium]
MPEGAAALDVPDAVRALIERGMALHAKDPRQADFLLAYALSLAPQALALYRTLYKFYHRQGRADLALDLAVRALQVAAGQAGLPADWRSWTPAALGAAEQAAASQALQALKAQAFLRLRLGDADTAEAILARLRALDPMDGSGVSVVGALLASVQG